MKTSRAAQGLSIIPGKINHWKTPYEVQFSMSADGGWTEWTDWEECSKKCGEGGGGQIRRRSCSNPAPLPQCGGKCEGDDFEYQECNNFPCKQNKLQKQTNKMNNIN